MSRTPYGKHAKEGKLCSTSMGENLKKKEEEKRRSMTRGLQGKADGMVGEKILVTMEEA